MDFFINHEKNCLADFFSGSSNAIKYEFTFTHNLIIIYVNTTKVFWFFVCFQNSNRSLKKNSFTNNIQWGVFKDTKTFDVSYLVIMVIIYCSLNKAKKEKENFFCAKFGSMPTFRSARKGKKCFWWWASTSIWPQGVTQQRIFIKFFFDFARILSLFSLVFRTSHFWSLRNLIKQLFHSRLLDMRLVIANSALRASLAIYHLVSNARSWNNC